MSIINGAYDVLWALAFALNRTMTMVESGDINGTDCQEAHGSLVPLHEFTYENEMMGCLIKWSLHQTNFSGVTVCNTLSQLNCLEIFFMSMLTGSCNVQ